MAWVNEISLSGVAVGDARRNSERAPWRFTLVQRSGKNDQEFSVHCWHDSGGEVKRGQRILVSGKLKHERWADSDGGRRERISVEADSILPDQPDQPIQAKPGERIGPNAPIDDIGEIKHLAKFPVQLPERPPIKSAPLRPVTEQDPITSDDIPF